MAYSESLARRVRHVLAQHRGITEKKMFGGLALNATYFERQGASRR